MEFSLYPLVWQLLILSFPMMACSFFDETADRTGRSDGYCSRILRTQGTRREGYTEFTLRVEGDPEFYEPGHSYRVTLSAASPSYFRGFILVSLKENEDGDNEEEFGGSFQVRREHL
nr:PREDICTED: spondin-1-like [Latimeria chalumnae]|eukprot:XP_005991310.2 PREDICTED: spondin-1-like [Latimeria chalumnae]